MTVYGPPGTDKLIAGIVQSLGPTEIISEAEQPGKWSPAGSVKVIILRSGADIVVDGVRVRTVQNSHFDAPPGHPQDNGTQSLSYRFDYEGYAIGYTGDTGPSAAVVTLEHEVNILFSEVTLRGTAGAGERRGPRPVGVAQQYETEAQTENDQQPIARTPETGSQPPRGSSAGGSPQYGQYHFEYQHLGPESAAKLAAAAGVKRLVFTHLAIPAPTDNVAPELIQQAQKFFKGEVTVARDLDRF